MRANQPDLPSPRARLAKVLRAAKDHVSIDTVTEALSVDRSTAAKLLSRWQSQGWLRRVGRGLYVPVPLDLAGVEQVLEDPWVLVPALFGQCYVGGWSAAHHWDLTEQLFNETIVFTTRRVTARRVTAQGTAFLVHHVSVDRMFGLKQVWRGATRVQVSDPARTMIDLLDKPEVGGGIEHVADCLAALMKQSARNADLLIRHAETLGNGAVFKRLGYLAEARLGNADLAAACRARLTKGHARLDPALQCDRLATAWRLWVPARWKGRAK